MTAKHRRKSRRIFPDALTIAYIAIGAARELDSRHPTPANLDHFGGELGFIDDIIGSALRLDLMGDDAEEATGNGPSVVWAYEVAEEYGRRVAAALIDGQSKRGRWTEGTPLRHDLARQLVLAAFA